MVSGQSQAHHASRQDVQLGHAFDLELSDELLSASVQHPISTYLRHERPGLVMVYYPRARFHQLLDLSRNFKSMNHSAMKKFVENRKRGRKILEFICQVGQICSEIGLKFVVDCPWPPSSWQARCLKKLEKLPSASAERYGSELQQLPDSEQDRANQWRRVITNHSGIRQAVAKETGRAGQQHQRSLVNLLISRYAKQHFRDTTKVKIQRYQDLIAEDRAFDEAYFTKVELSEIHAEPRAEDQNDLEIYHEEDEAVELNRQIFPDPFDIPEEKLEQEGWPELANKDWLYVAKDSGERPVPDANHPAALFPWRSIWLREEEGAWRVQEDEVRWQDLRDQQRRLPLRAKVATLFQEKINDISMKRMKNFPGMKEVTLEKLVRRAHEGLGHPDNNRLVRILRQSQAPEEAVQIAKDLKCSVCASYRLPDAPRKSAPPREAMTVNDLVGIDTVHLRDHNNVATPAVNIIDWNTHFQLVVPLPSETAEEVRKAYRQWVRFFGPPRRLMIDLGTEYKAAFRRQADGMARKLFPVPWRHLINEALPNGLAVSSRTSSIRPCRTMTVALRKNGRS